MRVGFVRESVRHVGHKLLKTFIDFSQFVDISMGPKEVDHHLVFDGSDSLFDCESTSCMPFF